MSTTRRFRRAGVAAAALVLAPAVAAGAGGANGPEDATLVGRAVLPVATYAPGPPSGTFLPPGVVNGITFPSATQPVEGFSSVVEGRRPGEFLMMPDNGYGGKATSKDFLIRAYYVTPTFKTAKGGSGSVDVDTADPINFRDPDGHITFSLVRSDRQLTGGDIDPESLQRDHKGDLWVGDEFGPWILHFDANGTLLEAPIPLPDGLKSPNNPFLAGGTATVNNSRGIEGMAISPDGKTLTVVLEGAVVADGGAASLTRRIYEYDLNSGTFERLANYQVDAGVERFVADVQALDNHRLLLIERDGAPNPPTNRHVYSVDLNQVGADGYVSKTAVIDLAAIPDPDGVSLPAIHAGDVGIGDPFQVMCESIEAVRVLSHSTVLLACDNNYPNKGRNPGLADDNEIILVKVPGL
jgi:glycerophosphoryl diester phosphodiesterase